MLILEITQEHIDKSEPMLEEKNPLGSALKEVFKDSLIHVGIHHAIIDNRHLILSPQLVQWLEDFDINGKEAVKPITCELDLSFN